MGRKAHRVSLRQPGCRNIQNWIFATRFCFAVLISGTGMFPRKKGDTMSGSRKKFFGPFPKLLTLILALATLLAPQVACSETLLLLLNADMASLARETMPKSAKRQTTVGLNENGDLVLRNGDISLTLAYNPPDEIKEPQERIRLAQKQETPAINGISFRVSMLF